MVYELRKIVQHAHESKILLIVANKVEENWNKNKYNEINKNNTCLDAVGTQRGHKEPRMIKIQQ